MYREYHWYVRQCYQLFNNKHRFKPTRKTITEGFLQLTGMLLFYSLTF